ncbi:MAG: hypothetical protein ACKVP4_13615 [Hyphomicrobium sp.]
MSIRHQRPRHRPNNLLFRVAFARARPCYCYGCIVLTRDEKAYERRVFNIAKAWGKLLKRERKEEIAAKA